jgi:hypothetical protein
MHILCINLKPKWSWTPNLTQSQTLQSRIGFDPHLSVHTSFALQHSLDAPHVLHDPLLDLTGAKEEGDAQGLRCVSSGCDVEEETKQCHL